MGGLLDSGWMYETAIEESDKHGMDQTKYKSRKGSVEIQVLKWIRRNTSLGTHQDLTKNTVLERENVSGGYTSGLNDVKNEVSKLSAK